MPAMKQKDLVDLYMYRKHWRKFLDWGYAPKGWFDFSNRIVLIDRETNEVVATVGSIDEMDEAAEHYLAKLFEKIVLANE